VIGRDMDLPPGCRSPLSPGLEEGSSGERLEPIGWKLLPCRGQEAPQQRAEGKSAAAARGCQGTARRWRIDLERVFEDEKAVFDELEDGDEDPAKDAVSEDGFVTGGSGYQLR
jgi:hypothetical protein